jgi:trimethylguanosine synthase
MPSEVVKYWYQRYKLFSKFDDGIKIDYEGWFSVTPEAIAIHIACRMKCDTIIDAFCGVGGNCIQFAKHCKKVIAIDIDPIRLQCAQHNAELYGVKDKIEFILGDFMDLAPGLQADAVFLSPPWGGVAYIEQNTFNINTMPVNGTRLFEQAQKISKNICYFLPKNIEHEQLIRLAGDGGVCELEQTFLDTRLKNWSIYYGNLVGK